MRASVISKLLVAAGLAMAPVALAAQPEPGGINMQPAATAVMEYIHAFHFELLVIITAISALVLALLIWVMIRYNRAANPVPKKFTHNLTVEVVWTVVPILILVFISARSFPLLWMEEQVPRAEMTVKVVGVNWGWRYEYQDFGSGVSPVLSNILNEDTARGEGRPWLLATTAPLVVPENTTVRVQVTADPGANIHSWTVPAFGVKEDAIPGRVNEGWFNVNGGVGTYYGQCSELCGPDHAFMPIEVKVVTREEFVRHIQSQGGTFDDAAPSLQQTAAGVTAAVPAR